MPPPGNSQLYTVQMCSVRAVEYTLLVENLSTGDEHASAGSGDTVDIRGNTFFPYEFNVIDWRAMGGQIPRFLPRTRRRAITAQVYHSLVMWCSCGRTPRNQRSTFTSCLKDVVFAGQNRQIYKYTMATRAQCSMTLSRAAYDFLSQLVAPLPQHP